MGCAVKEQEGRMHYAPAGRESLTRARYSFARYDAENMKELKPQPELCGARKDPPKTVIVWIKVTEGQVRAGGHLDAGAFLVRYDGPAPAEGGGSHRLITLLEPKGHPAGRIIAKMEVGESGCCSIDFGGESYRMKVQDHPDPTVGSALVTIGVYVARVGRTH